MERNDQSSTQDGINNNTYEMFFMDEYKGPRFAENDREFLMCAIEEFTKLDDRDIEYILEHANVFKREKRGFSASKNGLKYYFALLDTFFDDEIREDLRSDNRKGKCIQTSMSMAYNYEDDCKIMIGYIDNNKDKILHAVFVGCIEGMEIVFDYSKNVAMKKEDYIEINDYKVINEVSGKDFKEDYEYIKQLNSLSSKFYLCYRDEIMKDIKKNEKVFKLSK
ncbi:MAG: hypothetical protein IKF36_04925 [Bacilli bacterium]|nr:hypothetical protein [Bacilli bacterium]